MRNQLFLINHLREYKSDRTLSELYVDGEFFSYGLEDVGRPAGVKIHGHTCIPEGVYDAALNHSPKYGRLMIQLSNSSEMTVRNGNTSYTGIRVHGGNSTADTEGCPLIAYNTNGKSIWGRADKDLVATLEALPKETNIKWIINEL